MQQHPGRLLVEDLVGVAALGGLHAARAAIGAAAGAEPLVGGLPPAFGDPEPLGGVARTAGLSVVDEDRRRTGVGMEDGRDAADVPAVATGEHR
ncbi:hypothetical protein SDC9_152290 [bioreactor metagenome]|uniref:Uncharacterized protein n=1 Tax=bioreactor metagenome TaxID=1076179 RepID=A0A645EUB9_9ZZZZ